MGLKLVKFIFFGNYFIGLLAIALNLESSLQLNLPLNSFSYYLLVSLAPVIYYTYAYMGVNRLVKTGNPRTQWYIENAKLIKTSQLVLSLACLITLIYYFSIHWEAILHLPLTYWAMIMVPVLAALLYYGLLPAYFFNLNLRNTGWLKPFIIGFVWACAANLMPMIALKIERGLQISEATFWIWLFVKNWMFCTVNAVMFDLKDYEIDANKELKTFAVRLGTQRTISWILLPLLCIGLLSLSIFTYIADFDLPIVLFNAFPFILTIFVAYAMHRKKNIFFYLIIIDGLILVKALCGIAGVLLFNPS